MFFVALVIAIPELHPQTCHLDGNTLTMLAAGPAFAPLKWNVGQNNMGGYKGRLLFVPFDAPNTVPTVPDPGKAADNEALVTAAGTFAFPAEGTYKQPIYLYSTDATVDYKAEQQGEADGISYKQTLSFFFPGNTPEMHAFNALVKNTAGYYVFEDSTENICFYRSFIQCTKSKKRPSRYHLYGYRRFQLLCDLPGNSHRYGSHRRIKTGPNASNRII